MGGKQFGLWVGIVAVAASLCLGGCAALDAPTLDQALTVESRAELAGNPLKWEVALGNLLAGLRADPAERRVP